MKSRVIGPTSVPLTTSGHCYRCRCRNAHRLCLGHRHCPYDRHICRHRRPSAQPCQHPRQQSQQCHQAHLQHPAQRYPTCSPRRTWHCRSRSQCPGGCLRPHQPVKKLSMCIEYKGFVRTALPYGQSSGLHLQEHPLRGFRSGQTPPRLCTCRPPSPA
jgi:hypothetical protein